jgi:E3 ubiquitin-protein ligase NRDP1
VNRLATTQRQNPHSEIKVAPKRGARGTSVKDRNSTSLTQREPEELKQGKQENNFLKQSVYLMTSLLNSSDAFHDFSWDPEHSSKDIQFSKDCRNVFLNESNYYFRTVISNRPFSDGVHYWEIIADARTEHELKVGVTTQQQFNVNSSFSDYEFGFAYYGLGQLRHNSNSLGIPFGK